MCLFIAFAILDQQETFEALVNVINAFAGVNFTADDVNDLGKTILKMERDFNERAGLSSKDDRLPDYFRKEALAPHNITFQISDKDLDTVFNF
jgi:aldehyde:ferredoxin oxidoreductase